MTRQRPDGGTRVIALRIVAGALALWPLSSPAVTWIEQAQRDLTCTGLADPAERAALAAPWLPTPLNRATVERYFRGPPADATQAKFRHLTLLAAVGWWADVVNDQRLRREAYAGIAGLADAYAREDGAVLFRQVSRCARAQLAAASIELDEPAVAGQLAAALDAAHAKQPPAQPVEDWPLVTALRELRLEPRARDGIAVLTTRTTTWAGTLMQGGPPGRPSRLLAASAQGVQSLGDQGKAREIALQSLTVTGKPPDPVAAWRAMPVIYDATAKLEGNAAAAGLAPLLRPDSPPAALQDRASAFESLLRLSIAAETREQYEDMARLRQAAVRELTRQDDPATLSMPFYRRALLDLAGTRDATVGELAKRDPAFAAKTLATYTGLYDTLLAQAQKQFVADAREQLFFQYKIDNVLDSLLQLEPALPRSRAEIADTTFRLAQLRSYGRLTLATLAGELGRSRIDPEARFSVERYFTLATETGTWLRALLEPLQRAPGQPLPEGDTLWKAFFALDVFHEETAKQLDRYAAFVRQKAPAVAELATPRPLPAVEFQRRLRTGEALVATLVTPRDLYLWAVTHEGVTVKRQPVDERSVTELVTRLRASLVPQGAGRVPPFDAEAAHQLYRLVFEPLAPALKGVTDVTWFGHGPLGAVPPAVLVTSPPKRKQLSAPAELAATEFLVERYAFSSLADLSLFTWHRDKPEPSRADGSFLGVGASLLSTAELAGGPRARSYELAGGLDGRALAALPKLPESVDELKGLADIAGKGGATLWLGPEASEKRFVGDGLRGYSTIALATHGFLPGEVQGVPEPALLLALEQDSKDRFDGILTSREIAGLQLGADLVILSACNTAAADGRPRAEAFTGLSQAFFMAGARSLMVSHWPVMSGAAVQLTTKTMGHATHGGEPLSRSLQQAMRAVRKAGATSAIEAHPSYWGPFVVVGDGR